MARWTGAVLMTGLRLAGLYVIWLLIDDNVSEPELFTGIAVALLAFALAAVTRRLGTVRLRIRWRMLRYGYRPLPLMLADSFRVCWALVKTVVLRRPVRGRFRAVRYRATGDSPETVTRRALTEWSASIAPNRYVIGVDPSDDTLLVHELVATRGAIDPLELG